jgi:hypothetical protein
MTSKKPLELVFKIFSPASSIDEGRADSRGQYGTDYLGRKPPDASAVSRVIPDKRLKGG